MTEHRDIRFPRVRSFWQRYGATPLAVVGLITLAVLGTLYAVGQSAQRGKLFDCIIDLNKLTTQRNLVLSQVQADDRKATDDWIARVSLDVQTGHVEDLPAAYQAYRDERLINDKKRAKYGAGVKVKSACDFGVSGKVSAHALPSVNTSESSPTPSLPVLPTVTRTTITNGPTATVIFRTHVNVPGHTRTVRVRVTVTKTLPRPRPITRTVTRTRTKTVCPLPIIVPGVC